MFIIVCNVWSRCNVQWFPQVSWYWNIGCGQLVGWFSFTCSISWNIVGSMRNWSLSNTAFCIIHCALSQTFYSSFDTLFDEADNKTFHLTLVLRFCWNMFLLFSSAFLFETTFPLCQVVFMLWAINYTSLLLCFRSIVLGVCDTEIGSLFLWYRLFLLWPAHGVSGCAFESTYQTNPS